MSFPWKKLFLREAVSWFDNEAVIWSCFGSFTTSVLCRGKGTSWMGSFLNACQNCRIDAIAIHSYWCTLESWMKMKVSYKKLIPVKIGLLSSWLLPFQTFFRQFQQDSCVRYCKHRWVFLVPIWPGWDTKLGWELPPLRQEDLAYWVPWLI